MTTQPHNIVVCQGVPTERLAVVCGQVNEQRAVDAAGRHQLDEHRCLHIPFLDMHLEPSIDTTSHHITLHDTTTAQYKIM
jgi:hypothetical protein